MHAQAPPGQELVGRHLGLESSAGSIEPPINFAVRHFEAGAGSGVQAIGESVGHLERRDGIVDRFDETSSFIARPHVGHERVHLPWRGS